MSIPLDLNAEVTTAEGTRYRWGGNEPAGSRPQNLSFRTKLGEGFSDATLSLARRVDFDYPDLNLLDTVTVAGADGSVAYEGRVEAMPRELGDSHSIGVTLAGWIAHAKDKPFTEIYIDRDAGAWTEPSLGRKAVLLTNSWKIEAPSSTTDLTDQTAGVTTAVTGAWVSPYKPICEAWYDAGSNLGIGAIAYQWRRSGAMASQGVPSSWDWRAYVMSDDKGTSNQDTGDLDAAGPGSGTFTPITPGWRYGMLQVSYGATPAGADGATFAIDWYKLAVYGTHGLTLWPGEPGEPNGVLVSDVIKDIAGRFCPKLDTSGVQTTSYVVQHLAYKDLTLPYDAFLDLNKYHLWHLGVWEDKRLDFRPYGLTDYTWEVRTDEPGVQISWQGPSTENLYNGVVVQYTDLLTSKSTTLLPDNFPDLRDLTAENPYNQQGVDKWMTLKISAPQFGTSAVQLGRIALGQANEPKRPGTITVAGYIKDRAGNDQPVWKARAGDTVSITNFGDTRPRLIHETSYDDQTKTVTLSVEAPAASLDALFDRLSVALTARGLSG